MAEGTKDAGEGIRERRRWYHDPRKVVPLTAIAAVLLTAGGLALLTNIFERKQEARNPFYRVV